MTSNNSISSLDSLADGTNEFGSAQAGSKGSSSKKSGENHTQSYEDKKPSMVVLQKNNPTLNDPEVEVEKVVSGPDFSKGTMDDIVLTATPMTPFMASFRHENGVNLRKKRKEKSDRKGNFPEIVPGIHPGPYTHYYNEYSTCNQRI